MKIKVITTGEIVEAADLTLDPESVCLCTDDGKIVLPPDYVDSNFKVKPSMYF